MVMHSREFELIALGHVLSRYKITGELPNIGGKPFSLENFKEHLFAGVDADTDINININSIESTSNIVIVDYTECAADTSEPDQPPEQEQHQEHHSQQPIENKNLFKQDSNAQQ